MEHADALREMSVEKYLLGELTGSARDTFEEHLFECPLCAADVKSGVLFAEAARQELAAEVPQRAFPAENAPEKKRPGWFDSLFRPQWMAPALAACLLLIGYQAGVRIPALEQQVSLANTPQIGRGLAFSGGATRGGELQHVSAVEHGQFALAVDIPPQSGYTAYTFSLISPAGVSVWTQTVPAAEIQETEQIFVPAARTEAGKNTLVVQGTRADGPGSTMDDLQRHEFMLDLHK